MLVFVEFLSRAVFSLSSTKFGRLSCDSDSCRFFPLIPFRVSQTIRLLVCARACNYFTLNHISFLCVVNYNLTLYLADLFQRSTVIVLAKYFLLHFFYSSGDLAPLPNNSIDSSQVVLLATPIQFN